MANAAYARAMPPHSAGTTARAAAWAAASQAVAALNVGSAPLSVPPLHAKALNVGARTASCGENRRERARRQIVIGAGASSRAAGRWQARAARAGRLARQEPIGRCSTPSDASHRVVEGAQYASHANRMVARPQRLEGVDDGVVCHRALHRLERLAAVCREPRPFRGAVAVPLYGDHKRVEVAAQLVHGRRWSSPRALLARARLLERPRARCGSSNRGGATDTLSSVIRTFVCDCRNAARRVALSKLERRARARVAAAARLSALLLRSVDATVCAGSIARATAGSRTATSSSLTHMLGCSARQRALRGAVHAPHPVRSAGATAEVPSDACRGHSASARSDAYSFRFLLSRTCIGPFPRWWRAQVAGHRAEDGGPSTFTDESGLVLLKRVPRTDVGDREQAFYSCAELVRPPSTQRAPAPPPGTEACTWRPEAVACLLRVDASLARAASRQLAELTDVVPECRALLLALNVPRQRGCAHSSAASGGHLTHRSETSRGSLPRSQSLPRDRSRRCRWHALRGRGAAAMPEESRRGLCAAQHC